MEVEQAARRNGRRLRLDGNGRAAKLVMVGRDERLDRLLRLDTPSDLLFLDPAGGPGLL
jgi:hypothetical protein